MWKEFALNYVYDAEKLALNIMAEGALHAQVGRSYLFYSNHLHAKLLREDK